MANDNVLLSFVEKAVKKFSAIDDEGYEIQKMIEREQNKNNVFGFWSATEGVGTTTALVNIASSLAKDYSVCIVDLNILKPDIFRYMKPDLEISKKEQPKSLREKIINPTIPIAEFILKTKNPNISILTSLFSEHPAVYCETDTSDAQEKRIIDTYINVFRELATLFDFVFLDIDNNIIDVSSIAAFRSCDNVITFIGHSIKSYEYTIKTIKIFNEMGLYGIFNNVVQTMICNEAWKESEMQAMNPNFHLLANLPFSMDVHAVGSNLDIFIECNRSSDRNPTLYRNGIKQIASSIIQLAKESEVLQSMEELQKNASIITSGIQDYIDENHIDLAEIPVEDEDFILKKVKEGQKAIAMDIIPEIQEDTPSVETSNVVFELEDIGALDMEATELMLDEEKAVELDADESNDEIILTAIEAYED